MGLVLAVTWVNSRVMVRWVISGMKMLFGGLDSGGSGEA